MHFQFKETTNNPYLIHIGETSDHLYRFPSALSSVNKEWSNRKSAQTGLNVQNATFDVFRDVRPTLSYTNRKCDIVLTYSQEMHDMKQRWKAHLGTQNINNYS